LRKHNNKEALRLAFATLLGYFDSIERNLLFDGLSWQNTSQEAVAVDALREIISECNFHQCDKRERCRIVILYNALEGIEDTEEIITLFANIWVIIHAIPAALAEYHIQERELPKR